MQKNIFKKQFECKHPPSMIYPLGMIFFSPFYMYKQATVLDYRSTGCKNFNCMNAYIDISLKVTLEISE